MDLVRGVHPELPVGHNLMVARHLQKTPTRKKREEYMKHRNLSLPIVIFVSLLALPSYAASFPGQVVGVVDGDTIDVLRNGKSERIRLYGIDCPEKKQPYGNQAKWFTSDLTFRKTVTVIVKDRDRYGRTIGKVILPDGRSLNRELVRAGYAWWYRKYAPKDFELMVLQKTSKESKSGLWDDAEPVAPWEFRRKR